MKEDVDRTRRSLLWTGSVAGFAFTVPAALIGQRASGFFLEAIQCVRCQSLRRFWLRASSGTSKGTNSNRDWRRYFAMARCFSFISWPNSVAALYFC